MIRVLIAEDQGMVLGALAALLELEGDITVVAQAEDGAEALEHSQRTHKPDVLLTDIEMPKMTGLELAAEVKKGAAQNARHHPHDFCAGRLPAPRAHRGGVGLPSQRRARARARRGGAARS